MSTGYIFIIGRSNQQKIELRGAPAYDTRLKNVETTIHLKSNDPDKNVLDGWLISKEQLAYSGPVESGSEANCSCRILIDPIPHKEGMYLIRSHGNVTFLSSD